MSNTFSNVFDGSGTFFPVDRGDATAGTIYAIKPEGGLFWYQDINQEGQNGAQAERGWVAGSGNQISYGWEQFRHVFPARDGIFYAVTPEGTLLWYQDTDRQGQNGAQAERGWAPGSGNQISYGWEKFRLVFSGGGGIIYAITYDGRMRWYKDTDGQGQNGAQAERGWAPGSGNQISYGW
jgi:Tachylectin